MRKTKYIRFASLGIVVFADHYLMHSEIAASLLSRATGPVLSAGFIDFEHFQGGLPYCFGKSESLGKASLPDDTQILRKQWGLIK